MDIDIKPDHVIGNVPVKFRIMDEVPLLPTCPCCGADLNNKRMIIWDSDYIQCMNCGIRITFCLKDPI